jgi:pimeloyl-ACP methyl ester carboxylesterase
MPLAQANGIQICYEESGPADAPAVLLVNGYTSQLISWDERLIELFVDHGFRVVRFDNRDVGLTARTEGPLPTFVRSDAGLPQLDAPAPYTIADMASDGMALLEALGIERAHVAGVAMGGMIVQHMAFGHIDRVLTMTSIMSTTGDRSVGQARPEALAALLRPPPSDRDSYLDQAAETWRVISGPHYDEARSRDRAARAFDRAFNPAGAAFQMAAVLSDGDRTARLSGVRCPALVIHGRVDPLVTLSGGEATARAVPGAELLVLDEMGHDLPPPLLPDIVGAIAKLAARA